MLAYHAIEVGRVHEHLVEQRVTPVPDHRVWLPRQLADGFAILKQTRRVVLLSAYDDEQYLFQAMRAGAAGYLLKSIDGESLVRQLELAAEGQTTVDPTIGITAGFTYVFNAFNVP